MCGQHQPQNSEFCSVQTCAQQCHKVTQLQTNGWVGDGKMWEFFPSGSPTPPLTPVWEPHVFEEEKKQFVVYCAF